MTTAAVGAALLMATPAVPATAAATRDDPVDTTAGLIADVAPDDGEVLDGTTNAGQTTVEAGNATVTVPTDPAQPIVIDGPASTPALSVSLPSEVEVADAQVADDGTIVYQAADKGTTAAVQVLSDGSTRIQTITLDARAPQEFTYTFGDGIVPVVNTDGTVTLVQQTGGITVTLGSIDEAWAVDANGKPVNTSYQVRDGALVQNITPTDRTAYPVVADPSVSIGWRIYVKYNKSEVKRAATSSLNNKFAFQSLMCLAVPQTVVKAACALATVQVSNSIMNTVRSAHKAGKCVQIEYSLVGGAPLAWKAVAC